MADQRLQLLVNLEQKLVGKNSDEVYRGDNRDLGFCLGPLFTSIGIRGILLFVRWCSLTPLLEGGPFSASRVSDDKYISYMCNQKAV